MELLTSDIIKTLNSQHIGDEKNKDKVKAFMKEYWDSAPNQRKKLCISLANYVDSRPYWLTKNTGKISVRMVLSLSLGILPSKLNPFYVCGLSDDKEYSDDKLIDFLKYTGFENIAKDIYNKCQSLETNIVNEGTDFNFVVEEFKSTIKTSSFDSQYFSKISFDDIVVLLKNLEVKTRIANDLNSERKLKLIKLILLSN